MNKVCMLVVVVMCLAAFVGADVSAPGYVRGLYVRETLASRWLAERKVGDFDPILGRKVTEADRDAVASIARQPQAAWVDRDDTLPILAKLLAEATQRRQVMAQVLYRIPNRDKGGYSKGGAGSREEYLAFVDRFANTIGDHRTMVVVEPDAIGHAFDADFGAEKRAERFASIRDVVQRLKRQKECRVYPDATKPNWLSPEKAAEGLIASGIAEADGFAVNVSGYETTADCIAFARKVSALVGGKPCVIDTSRNGNGPWNPTDPNEKESWCNPPGRAIGMTPVVNTGAYDPVVDALLWFKPVGESDGTCRGNPPAGTFSPKIAIEQATAGKK